MEVLWLLKTVYRFGTFGYILKLDYCYLPFTCVFSFSSPIILSATSLWAWIASGKLLQLCLQGAWGCCKRWKESNSIVSRFHGKHSAVWLPYPPCRWQDSKHQEAKWHEHNTFLHIFLTCRFVSSGSVLLINCATKDKTVQLALQEPIQTPWVINLGQNAGVVWQFLHRI